MKVGKIVKPVVIPSKSHSAAVFICALFLRPWFRGLLYGTNLISYNLFCDVIFSLTRIICYTQFK